MDDTATRDDAKTTKRANTDRRFMRINGSLDFPCADAVSTATRSTIPLDSLEEAPSHAASGSMIRAEASPGGLDRIIGSGSESVKHERAREQGEQGAEGARERGTETRLLHLFCDFLRKGWARIVSPWKSEEMFVHLVRFTRPNVRSSGVACPANVRFLGCDLSYNSATEEVNIKLLRFMRVGDCESAETAGGRSAADKIVG